MLMVDRKTSRRFLAVVHGFQRRSHDGEVLRIGTAVEARAEGSEGADGIPVCGCWACCESESRDEAGHLDVCEAENVNA